MKKENLIGKIYGKLTILSFSDSIIYPKTEKSKQQIKRVVNCICECGNFKTLKLELLKSGHSKSCGCLRKEMMSNSFTIHGLSDTTEFTTWRGMKQRCNDKNSSNYQNYGGRGITMCERWLNSFENFLEDMGKKPTFEHSIERKDNNLGYYKENCYWATNKEQANNKRSNKLITYKGKTQSLANWCRELNLNYYKIRSRFTYNWNVKKAFETK